MSYRTPTLQVAPGLRFLLTYTSSMTRPVGSVLDVDVDPSPPPHEVAFPLPCRLKMGTATEWSPIHAALYSHFKMDTGHDVITAKEAMRGEALPVHCTFSSEIELLVPVLP